MFKSTLSSPAASLLSRRCIASISRKTSSCFSSVLRDQRLSLANRLFHINQLCCDKTNMLICFGSQTGTAQMFAENLKSELLGKKEPWLSNVKVVDLNDIEPEKVMGFGMQEGNGLYNVVLFVMANYGEGQPTDNAKQFYDWLMSDNSKAVLQNASKTPHYAIFGLGNSANFPERYQAVGRKMEKRLNDMGVSLVFKRGEGDDGGDAGIETDFEVWKNDFVKFLKEQDNGTSASTSQSCNVTVDKSKESVDLPADTTSNGKYFFRTLDFEKYRDKLRQFIREYDSSQSVSPKNPYTLFIDSAKNLCPRSSRKRLEIEFSIDNTPINYETGDHIALFPMNSPDLINRLEKVLKLDKPMDKIIFTLQTPPCSIESPPFIATPEKPVSLHQVMSQFYDLNGVITPSLLTFFAEKATLESEKAKLEQLRSTEYLAGVKNRMLNIVEILEMFPSIKVTWQDLIGVLPKIQPRYYSISSSRLENEERKKRSEKQILRVTFSPLVWPQPDGRTFYGLCSNYLGSLKVHDPCQSVVRTSSFRLPQNPMTPILMLAGGTGIAPMRA